jgi:hypothetical protein
MIAAASGGIPRMINILCDTALVYGFARGEKTISAKLVEEVIADKQQYSYCARTPVADWLYCTLKPCYTIAF